MTLKPEETKREDFLTTKTDQSNAILEDLFTIGYTKSKNLLVYKDGATEFYVQFRTLTPVEFREVFEATSRFSSAFGQDITSKLEILARSIVTINNMPLILDEKDRKDFYDKYDRDPTPGDQARYILIEKIKSSYIIDFLFEAFQKFNEEVKAQFDDIKKKLNVT